MKAVRSAAAAAAARPSAARQVQPSAAPSSHGTGFVTRQRRVQQLRCSAGPAGGPPPGAGGGAGRDYQVALITGGNTGESALSLQATDWTGNLAACRLLLLGSSSCHILHAVTAFLQHRAPLQALVLKPLRRCCSAATMWCWAAATRTKRRRRAPASSARAAAAAGMRLLDGRPAPCCFAFGMFVADALAACMCELRCDIVNPTAPLALLSYYPSTLQGPGAGSSLRGGGCV